MLQKFGKTLLALIAVVLIADPVMACCFPTSADLNRSETQETQPPCHGAKAPSPTDAVSESTNNSCPGCGDCSSSMMSSGHTELLALSTNTSFEFDEAANYKLPIPREVLRTAERTAIPSGQSPHPTDTPISLKQKLLI